VAEIVQSLALRKAFIAVIGTLKVTGGCGLTSDQVGRFGVRGCGASGVPCYGGHQGTHSQREFILSSEYFCYR
ncbi:hypothetical protein BDU57DRAFT_452399, partial [Ampelomyces quisqualis]